MIKTFKNVKMDKNKIGENVLFLKCDYDNN